MSHFYRIGTISFSLHFRGSKWLADSGLAYCWADTAFEAVAGMLAHSYALIGEKDLSIAVRKDNMKKHHEEEYIGQR